MKSCPICGAPNPDEGMICEQCGASLGAVLEEGGLLCSVCGYRNPSEAIFCEQCGARLAPEAAPAAGSPEEAAPAPVEPDWVAALAGLFPELPAEEEAAPIPSLEAELSPEFEEGIAAPPLWEETPTAEEAEIPEAFEPTPAVPPFEGLPPEIAAPWPTVEETVEEGEALPSFPWLEPLEEAPAPQPPEAAMPPVEWPPVEEAEGPAPASEVPFTEWPAGSEPGEAEELPEWLRALGEAEQPMGWTEEGAPGEAEKPPGLAAEAIPESPVEPFAAWPLEEGPLAAPELPEELPMEEPLAAAGVFQVAEGPAIEAPPPPAEVPPFTDVEAVLAEMPEWLQALQPVPEEEGEAPSEAIPRVEPAVVEAHGPLAGLVDVLPRNLRLVEIHGPAARLRAEPSPELLARAQAWQSWLDQGLSFLIGERAAEPVPAGLGAAVERWLLFALLVGALILGLYWPLPFFRPALLAPPGEFQSRLDQVSPGDIALVAVDYGPDRAAELEPYLRATLDRLTARGARVLTVSLSPWGAAQAAPLVQGRPDYGERVVHLGYYPGQEVGIVRLLTRPLGQLGVDYRGQLLQELPLARDFGEEPLAARLRLVVLITGSPEALRGWVQQASGVLPPGASMIAAVGANVAPYAAPYRESGQLGAVAIGLRDALLLDGLPPEGSPAFFDLQAQTTLQVLIIGLIGVGLVIRLFRSPKAASE